MKNRRLKDEKRKGEKGKDKRTVFASFTSIAGSRKNAYTPYSDMVLRHDNVLNFIVKSLDIKGPVVSDFIRTLVEPIEDVCNERATVLKTGMKVKLLVKDGLIMLFQLGEFFFSVHRHSFHFCHLGFLREEPKPFLKSFSGSPPSSSHIAIL